MKPKFFFQNRVDAMDDSGGFDGSEASIPGMTDGAAIAAGFMLLAANHLSAMYLQTPLLPVLLIGCVAIVGGASGVCLRRLLHQHEKLRVSFKRRYIGQRLLRAGLNALIVAAGLALGAWLWVAYYR